MRNHRLIALALVVASCVAIAPPALARKAPELTPLELQSIQSKEFETSKENLFGAVMTVIQDLGYQVQAADVNTGFITAVSATVQKTNFFEALGGVSSSGNTKLTAYVQKMPNGMARVRLTFLNTRTASSAYGQTLQQDKPILDPMVYRNAWDKIDEALFVLGSVEAKKSPPSTQEGAAPANDMPAAH